MDDLRQKREHSAYSPFDTPEGLFKHHPIFPKCLLVLNIVLLALTAQIFRANVFATPVVYPVSAPPQPDCSGVNKTVCQGDQVTGPATSCLFQPAKDGQSCGQGRECSFGNCLLPTDPTFGQVCEQPADTRCALQTLGTMVKGDCQYQYYADGTLCDAVLPENNNTKTYRGYLCVNHVCSNPTRIHVANQAYQWSITTGLVGAAVAIEFIATNQVSVDLALLAMNVGLILIGWDGRLYDTGLEVNTALGRSHLALGFVCGGAATLLAIYAVFGERENKKEKKLEHKFRFWGVILLVAHGVTVGLVARAYNETFAHYQRFDVIDQFSIVGSFAWPASLFAAAVAIAVAVSVLTTGRLTAGLSALTYVTGVIEIGWAAANYQQGVNNRDDASGRNFTGTVKAWEAWAIIAGAASIIGGAMLQFQASKAENRPKEERELPEKGKVGSVASLMAIVFYVAIGLTASLFQNYFFDRQWSIFGNNMRIVGGNHNFGNQASGFAWEHSIWSAAIAASLGMSVVKQGGISGIAALTLTFAVNLIGWAAEHHAIGSVVNDSSELRGRARAWEAICLVSGVIAFFVASSILRALHKADDPSRTASQPITT